MNTLKYIGMDVHKAMTVIVVLNREGRVISEAIVETKSPAILDFIRSQRGTIHVAFEESTQAAWLHDLISPHIADVVVCDPRRITKQGNKGDKIDAQRLAELLRTKALVPIYHDHQSTRSVKELVRSYKALVQDSTRIKNRIKALFLGRGISCTGDAVYDPNPNQRKQWLAKIDSAGARTRADRLLEELDCVRRLVAQAELDLIQETRKHPSTKILKTIPGIGPLRAAVILGNGITPHRFRTKRQFWNYSGLGVVQEISAEFEMDKGKIRRSNKRPLVRGLNHNYNRALKEAFKGAAKTAVSGPWKNYFNAIVANGTVESLALLTVARKIAAITLALWKRGERYDPDKLNSSQML
jgi:transposase